MARSSIWRHSLLPFLLAAAVLVVTACGEEEDEPARVPPAPTPPPAAEAGLPDALPPEVDYEETDPLAFLDLLARHPGTLLNVQNAPEGWISEAHVAKLLSRIDDPAPAAVVVSYLSSYIPFGETSTVGREAMFLIQGFREGFYPPTICSVSHFDPDPSEMRRWWKERKKG